MLQLMTPHPVAPLRVPNKRLVSTKRNSGILGSICPKGPQRAAEGRPRAPKGSQKPNPKPTKIEEKNRCEKNTSSRPSWSRLGTILGRFGTDLGVMFIDLSLVFKAFRENQRFSKNITSRAVLDRSKADFGPTWLPK